MRVDGLLKRAAGTKDEKQSAKRVRIAPGETQCKVPLTAFDLKEEEDDMLIDDNGDMIIGRRDRPEYWESVTYSEADMAKARAAKSNMEDYDSNEHSEEDIEDARGYVESVLKCIIVEDGDLTGTFSRLGKDSSKIGIRHDLYLATLWLNEQDELKDYDLFKMQFSDLQMLCLGMLETIDDDIFFGMHAKEPNNSRTWSFVWREKLRVELSRRSLQLPPPRNDVDSDSDADAVHQEIGSLEWEGPWIAAVEAAGLQGPNSSDDIKSWIAQGFVDRGRRSILLIPCCEDGDPRQSLLSKMGTADGEGLRRAVIPWTLIDWD